MQALYFVGGGILLIGAILVGAVVLVFVLAAALILGLIVYARVWWLQRKLARAGRAGRTGPTGAGMRSGRTSARGSSGDILEVEYTVVEERDESDGRS